MIQQEFMSTSSRSVTAKSACHKGLGSKILQELDMPTARSTNKAEWSNTALERYLIEVTKPSKS